MQDKLKLYTKKLLARDTHPELPLDPDVVQPGRYSWPVHFRPSLQFVVFAGGFLGALARYKITEALPTTKNALPTTTLLINLLGAFLLGVLLEALARSGEDKGLRRAVRLGVGTGFMGAFTTYSTLAVEADLLARDDNIATAVLYVLVSVAAGVALSALGVQAAAQHHKKRTRVQAQ